MTLPKYMSKESQQEKFSGRKKDKICIFPCANGSVKLAGQGSEVRPSNRSRQHIEHGSDLQGETDEQNKMTWKQSVISGVSLDHVQERKKFASARGKLLSHPTDVF